MYSLPSAMNYVITFCQPGVCNILPARGTTVYLYWRRTSRGTPVGAMPAWRERLLGVPSGFPADRPEPLRRPTTAARTGTGIMHPVKDALVL